MLRSVVILPLLLATTLMARATDDKDLIDRLVLDPTLKTFTKFVARAGMIEQLKGNGPFTIFAPNDAAFAKVPAKTMEALLKDRVQLRKFVSLHIFSGKMMVKDLKEGPLKTIGGDSIAVTLKGGLTVGGAKILTPDGAATNGLLQIVNMALIPLPTKPAK